MKKQAVGKQTGGFMQTRSGRRPIRADNLIKQPAKRPSEVFHSWDGSETRAEDSKAADSFITGVATDRSDEFSKEAELKIRKATDNDLDEFGMDWVQPGDENYVAIKTSRRGYQRNRELVGVSAYDPKKKELTQLWVSPPHRRQGIATKLMVAHGDVQNVMAAKRPAARKFYKSQGFVQSGKSEPKHTPMSKKAGGSRWDDHDLDQNYSSKKKRTKQNANWSLKGTEGIGPLEGAILDKVGSIRQRLLSVQEMQKEGARRFFAPGIPIERRIKHVSEVREEDPNEDWNISVSMHPARIRGDHIDLRLVDPKNRAHSWALTQPKMPEPGKSSYAVQQATHSGRYAMRKEPFEIPPGYGATRPGTKVQPLDVGSTEIVRADQDHIRFLTHRGQKTNEYTLRRIRGTRADDGKPMWALNNATKNVNTVAGKRIPLGKPKYHNQKLDDVDVNDDQQVVQAKIDGSHVVVSLEGQDRPNRVYSYRQAKRDTGLIEHTFKFPDYHKRKSPQSLKGTVLRAELWASKNGKAVPPERVGALLNSGVPKSRKMQQESGEKLRLSAFDVVRHKGRDVSKKTYAEKLEILREAAQNVPGIELPPMEVKARKKLRLIKRIKEGKLPHTAEGTIQWDLHRPGAAPKKSKIRPDQDVYVKGVFSKSKGEARGHAGGFTYSTSPGGPVVGRVGTGFDHSTRADMRKNPERYVGRVAKVESQGPHKSGALRAPSFKGWHIDKTDPELLGDE